MSEFVLVLSAAGFLIVSLASTVILIVGICGLASEEHPNKAPYVHRQLAASAGIAVGVCGALILDLWTLQTFGSFHYTSYVSITIVPLIVFVGGVLAWWRARRLRASRGWNLRPFDPPLEEHPVDAREE